MGLASLGEVGSMIMAAVEWGLVRTWAGATATVLMAITTALVALGYFDGLQGPRPRPAFEATEPWCRQGKTEQDGTALWVRVGVEVLGGRQARGCLSRLISVATNGEVRPNAAALGRSANDSVLTAEER